MIAEIVARGATREDAPVRLDAALAQTRIEGAAIDLALRRRIVRSPVCRAGGVEIQHSARLLAEADR